MWNPLFIFSCKLSRNHKYGYKIYKTQSNIAHFKFYLIINDFQFLFNKIKKYILINTCFRRLVRLDIKIVFIFFLGHLPVPFLTIFYKISTPLVYAKQT